MRLISMVPSWTETLLAAGIPLVGRTRYCVHPEDRVKSIAIVGGTKNCDLKKISALQPDLLILDKEENPVSMSEMNWPFFATHVEGIKDVGPALLAMADRIESNTHSVDDLRILAERWSNISPVEPRLENLPVIEWLTSPSPFENIHRVYYLIWNKPWMAVTSATFIGSVLEFIGWSSRIWPQTAEKKYPIMDWNEMNQPGNLLLFSSEPYPFLKKKNEIPELHAAAAIVDGEKLSWFGLRSLEYLESLKR